LAPSIQTNRLLSVHHARAAARKANGQARTPQGEINIISDKLSRERSLTSRPEGAK
jgi:hypothetical protein